MVADIERPPQVTLKTYVNILMRAARGEIKLYHELEGAEFYAARELKNSGMLSQGEVLGVAEAIVLTPEGAIALESWSRYLKEASIAYKIKENFLRFLWVIVGAIAASIGGYLR